MSARDRGWGEAEFRTLAECLPDYIVEIDRQRRYRWVNRVAEGLTLDQVLGARIDEFADPEQMPAAIAAIERCFETGEQTEYIASGYGDGHETWHWEVRVVPAPPRDGDPRVLLLTRNVTERVRAEEAKRRADERHQQLQSQLEQAQRLESLGLLAGGVAHDFNNLLTVIMTGARLAERRLSQGRDPSPELEQVCNAAGRGANLTQQLLAFGQRSTLEVGALDLAVTIRQVIDMARRLLPETIEVTLEAPDEPVTVHGDRHQLEQALLNLCINARDAMPDGGRLAVQLAVDAGQAVVTVNDTGEGIAADDLERVFEPFFTTKPQGTGSGLGLAMVHGIVLQHSGNIAVRSSTERGTEFEIRLPLCDGVVADDPEPAAPLLPGRGRILMAEDEGAVADLVKAILEAEGYQVVAARDGQEAVEVFEAEAGDFDLLLLDAVMPRLDGWRAYERMRALRPAIPVLFASGYAAGAIRGNIDEQRPALLAKPYDPDTLLRAVSTALRSR